MSKKPFHQDIEERLYRYSIRIDDHDLVPIEKTIEVVNKGFSELMIPVAIVVLIAFILGMSVMSLIFLTIK